MRSEPREVEHLLPLFVTGNLSDEEHRQVTDCCEDSPELARELRELQDVRDSYRVLESELPAPSPDLFERVQGAIAGTARDRAAAPATLTWGDRVWTWLGGLFGTPALAWGTAAVQLVVIGWLVATPRPEPDFQTLSAPTAAQAQGVRINVMFRVGTTEEQLRRALVAVGAEIVSGPTPKGLYVVELGPETPVAEGLERLRASGLTRFVAEAY